METIDIMNNNKVEGKKKANKKKRPRNHKKRRGRRAFNKDKPRDNIVSFAFGEFPRTRLQLKMHLQNLFPENAEDLSNPISSILPPDHKIKRYKLVKKDKNNITVQSKLTNLSDKIIDLESGEGTSQLFPSENGPTQDDDCILVENHISVIVIDDENPGDNVSIKTESNFENGAAQESKNSEFIKCEKKVNEDDNSENNSNVVEVSDFIPLNKLEIAKKNNSIFEVESELSDISSDEVEIVKIDDEICTLSQTSDLGSIINSSMSNKSKSEQQGTSSFPMENKENENFYEDHKSGLGESVVPLYNKANAVKSRKRKRRKRKAADDSVVFLSEEIDLDEFNPIKRTFATEAPQFIPLTTNEIKNDVPAKKIESNPSQTSSIVSSSTSLSREVAEILTHNDKKTSEEYRNNTYNQTKDLGIPNLYNPRKRMIIVDASNVAFAHSLSKEFSVKGLEICINYFEKMGHEVKAVLPLNRGNPRKSTDPKRLSELHRAGKIVFTPCKNLPGLSSTSYDDRFILQLAVEFDAAVISNDNYRDLLNESLAFRYIIENRVIGYTWCNDVFILPKDPYGRLGPSLSVILNRI